jgi:hypothetical protein
MRDKPVAEISTQDVLGVLKPLWIATPVTASRTRDRIERVLDAAKARGYRTGENPGRWKGNLKDLDGPARADGGQWPQASSSEGRRCSRRSRRPKPTSAVRPVSR